MARSNYKEVVRVQFAVRGSQMELWVDWSRRRGHPSPILLGYDLGGTAADLAGGLVAGDRTRLGVIADRLEECPEEVGPPWMDTGDGTPPAHEEVIRAVVDYLRRESRGENLPSQFPALIIAVTPYSGGDF